MAEGVEPLGVEVGGHEVDVVGGEEAIRAVVEALAGDGEVVGVEDAVDEARHHEAGAEGGARARDGGEEARGAVRTIGDLGKVVGDRVREEAFEARHVGPVREALEGAEANVRVAEAHQHRRACRRRLVAAHERLAGLEEAERLRGGDAERFQHLGGEDLTHPSFEREPPVAPAGPRGRPAPLGAEVEESARVVQQLGEEKASPVAEVRVVHVELMAVVAERQRGRKVARQRLEPPEVRLPLAGIQRPEPDALGPALVAEAERAPGKACGGDLVVELLAERGVPRGGVIARGDGHGEAGRGRVTHAARARDGRPGYTPIRRLGASG